MAPVLNTGPLKVSEHEMLIFSVRKEIIKNDNSLVVILLSKVSGSFLHTSSNVGAVGSYCFPAGAVGGYCFPVGAYCE